MFLLFNSLSLQSSLRRFVKSDVRYCAKGFLLSTKCRHHRTSVTLESLRFLHEWCKNEDSVCSHFLIDSELVWKKGTRKIVIKSVFGSNFEVSKAKQEWNSISLSYSQKKKFQSFVETVVTNTPGYSWPVITEQLSGWLFSTVSSVVCFVVSWLLKDSRFSLVFFGSNRSTTIMYLFGTTWPQPNSDSLGKI